MSTKLHFKKTYGSGQPFKSDKIVPKKIKKYVKNAVKKGQEIDYFDTAPNIATFGVPTQGTMQFHLLNNLIKGDDEGNRTGNAIKMRYLQVRIGVFASREDDAPTYHYGIDATTYMLKQQLTRIMVVRDKQANNAQFTATDLLKTTTVNGLLNHENKKRFHIYKDLKYDIKVFDQNRIVYDDEMVQVGYITLNIPLKNVKVEYSANNGTIADITRNSLYLCLLWQNTSPVATELSYKFVTTSRLFYVA